MVVDYIVMVKPENQASARSHTHPIWKNFETIRRQETPIFLLQPRFDMFVPKDGYITGIDVC
jgi:hypothetical protein